MSYTITSKNFLFNLVALLFFAFSAGAQQTAEPEATLKFKEMEYNFSKIPQGKPVFHLFEVVNSSAKAVKIENVQASCGCTTPEWSREEVAPGAKTIIKVGYNAAAEGPFEKTITVSYAGTATVLRIKGEVWKTPGTPAPSNASVQFLNKQLQN
jgi:hypothetical protein